MEMNWLETTYPSPAFPSHDRSMPGVGSTHYFIAYTWVHGSYPPLRQRIDPGLSETESDPTVTNLQQRVEVTCQKDRANFAPRITIRTRSGDELKWDLATETKQISALFGGLPWLRAQLDSLVSTVAELDQEPSIAGLIKTCVPA